MADATSSNNRSPVARFLGPLVPLGLATFGIWLLISGRYVYRPGRSNAELVLLAPDVYIAGAFFIFLALLVAAIGVSGKKSWGLFFTGLAGSLISFSVEAWRQIAGLAVYG